ncbi:helix-turn-helix transcriptional regulator [Paenibacillus sp. NPDC056579]|uniref:helix-turn-helix transcriptional regulator n=1 Tax=Paenibacillus sp. NPDC056579 TaxID=3345871 RepID=UPI003675AE74
MKADRLLSILLLLQNHGRMSSRELADKLEVSERTIFRDMEALSMSGIPVYAERGAKGGWVLSEGYRTQLTGMKTEEILSLLLSNPSHLLDDLGLRTDFEAAYQKLLAASPSTIRSNAEIVRQRIHIDGAGWHQLDESYPLLSAVQEAVWGERKLVVQYRRDDGTVERLVHPLGVVAKRSVWYLVAQVDGDLRTYRISRLQSAQMLEETFERPAGFDLESYWEQSKSEFKTSLPLFPALLKIREPLRSRFAQERYARILRSAPRSDGWLEAAVQFQTLDSAVEIVLFYGSNIEVLAPSELLLKVTHEVKAMAALYGIRE